MAELEIASRSIRESPNVLLLERFEGGIDAKSYPVLEQALAKVQKDGCCRLVLKLAGVRFMNEAERLLSYDAAFRKAGGGLVLYEVPAKLRVLFGTLELDKKLAIRGSIDDAIAALVEGQPVDRRQRAKAATNDRVPREGDRPPPAVEGGGQRRVWTEEERRAAREASASAKPAAGTAKPAAAPAPRSATAKSAAAKSAPVAGAKSAAPKAASSAGTARPIAAKSATGPTASSGGDGAKRSAKSSAGPSPRAAPSAPSAVVAPSARRGSALVALVVVGLVAAAYVAYAFLFAK